MAQRVRRRTDQTIEEIVKTPSKECYLAKPEKRRRWLLHNLGKLKRGDILFQGDKKLLREIHIKTVDDPVTRKTFAHRFARSNLSVKQLVELPSRKHLTKTNDL